MKKLPEFKTQDEEIKFWEKHSIAEYWDDIYSLCIRKYFNFK